MNKAQISAILFILQGVLLGVTMAMVYDRLTKKTEISYSTEEVIESVEIHSKLACLDGMSKTALAFIDKDEDALPDCDAISKEHSKGFRD